MCLDRYLSGEKMDRNGRCSTGRIACEAQATRCRSRWCHWLVIYHNLSLCTNLEGTHLWIILDLRSRTSWSWALDPFYKLTASSVSLQNSSATRWASPLLGHSDLSQYLWISLLCGLASQHWVCLEFCFCETMCSFAFTSLSKLSCLVKPAYLLELLLLGVGWSWSLELTASCFILHVWVHLLCL